MSAPLRLAPAFDIDEPAPCDTCAAYEDALAQLRELEERLRGRLEAWQRIAREPIAQAATAIARASQGAR